MPNYLTPGVYVEEVPATSKPIEGVGTSTAAFVGLAPGGPLNRPVRLSNWTQFAKQFSDPRHPENGPFMSGAYLAHALYGFFQNGGSTCWVVRVGGGADAADGAPSAQAALPSAGDDTLEAFRAVALEGVDGDISIEIAQEAHEPKEGEDNAPTYRLTVVAGARREEHEGLTLKRGRTYIVTKVNSASQLIKLEETGRSLPDNMRVPATGTFTLIAPPPSAEPVTAQAFEGDVAKREGLGGFAPVDEITMLCVPDVMALAGNGSSPQITDVQGKMIAHAQNSGDRMVILDPPPNLNPQEILEWRMAQPAFDNKFATLYWPWIEVMDPITKQPIMVPPSGHVAGVWARTDSTRGVHKAPANEVVLGANGLAFQITHEEQGELNRTGINCIRVFPGRGIRIWGARTLASDPEWRYLNVRRLFNYVTESIAEGTQWAVFEPNDERLWTSLRISVSNFLLRVWRDGALFGATPEEAYFVKCDAETNPPEQIEAGQVTVEIGISPSKPAEFVVFRISQFTAGGAEISA